MSRYVNFSENLSPLFEEAERIVEPLLNDHEILLQKEPMLADGGRFVVNHSDSMVAHLHGELEKILGNAADNVIYKIGKACGVSDAERLFMQKHSLNISPCPIVLALGNDTLVKLLPESLPRPNENFILAYELQNSSEAEDFLRKGLDGKIVCYLNAGYAAGWCSKAFGLNLDAKEVACRGKGHAFCRFIMAPPFRLRERVSELCGLWGIPVGR